MTGNLYHLLSFIPATEGWEMPPALEALARALVASGKLRINADTERNFVRLGTRNSDQTFTARELTDPALAQATQAALARHVAPAEGAAGLAQLHARLLADLKKARGVDAAKEMKVARVLVQSAEPAIIQLLLRSGTEIFVSYAHTVADLMPVHAWETHGTASGMQQTGGEGTAVFVSAGGDPFFAGEHKHYVTDGFPALARMVVIAGQELGHFADLRHTRRGIAGRHSTDPHHTQLRAAPAAALARLADMDHVAELKQRYLACGLARLRRAEQSVAFYHQRLRYTPPWLFHQLWRGLVFGMFYLKTQKLGIYQPLRVQPRHRHGEALALYLEDMAFNLAPDADVYRHPDPQVEEAIAVIEAVARVPQQSNKWGNTATYNAWPNLHRFYYGTVIPGAKQALDAPLERQTIKGIQKLIVTLRHCFRARPDHYPEPAGSRTSDGRKK